MQIILQEKIRNLGMIGDIVDVKPGYARNYLLKQGKAMVANKTNIEVVNAKRKELEKLEKERIKEAKVRVKGIEAAEKIEIKVHTNEEGKLFGSIGAAEVVDYLAEKGINVHKSEVTVVEMPIRFIGEYTVLIECYADVNAKLPLILTSDNINIKESQEEESQAATEEEIVEASDDEALEDDQTNSDAE